MAMKVSTDDTVLGPVDRRAICANGGNVGSLMSVNIRSSRDRLCRCPGFQ